MTQRVATITARVPFDDDGYPPGWWDETVDVLRLAVHHAILNSMPDAVEGLIVEVGSAEPPPWAVE